MGSASSKAARTFPKRSPPPWAGTRTAPPSEPAVPARPTAAKASEQRTADIEKDAGDPDFLANLSRLGPVRVDHVAGAQTAQTGPAKQVPHAEQGDNQVNQINRLFRSRAASEEEASSLKPARNHLYAGSLHELLDERKGARTVQDLENLAKKYGIDLDKIERLARCVTSPSVERSRTVTTVDSNGEETVTWTAVWVNPHIHA